MMMKKKSDSKIFLKNLNLKKNKNKKNNNLRTKETKTNQMRTMMMKQILRMINNKNKKMIIWVMMI